ncbi:hypothetical protein [Kamptonema formosum]|uniref:hypothetical protein n=1 Tax=Kamptonema formosum TaxID=331992 RepID=UPI0012DF3DD5|nr:hypothetical protein [Oscillatoria sp. PCC 10802]
MVICSTRRSPAPRSLVKSQGVRAGVPVHAAPTHAPVRTSWSLTLDRSISPLQAPSA